MIRKFAIPAAVAAAAIGIGVAPAHATLPGAGSSDGFPPNTLPVLISCHINTGCTETPAP